jgi:Na+/melibiose symporter-like transporter
LKFETTDRLEAGKSVAAFIGIAAILGLLAGFMAFVAIAKGLTALGVPDPLSYAIVAVVAGVVAVVLLKISQQRVKERIMIPLKFKKG